jgi:aspartate racemase
MPATAVGRELRRRPPAAEIDEGASMKTIGVIGGMSWESTVDYYRYINQEVARRLGGLHSAELVLYSVDFAPIEEMQTENRWDDAGRALAAAARRLEAAGAELLVLATNTMHKVAPAIEGAVEIPLLHIADPTGAAIREAGITTVGLLGTRYTMEGSFYRGRLEERFGLSVLVPPPVDRALIDGVIFEELCFGVTKSESKRRYLEIIAGLADRGAEGVILGCTEIGALISPLATRSLTAIAKRSRSP